MQGFQDGFAQLLSWFKFFKGPDWILPIVGALAAATYFSWKLRKMKTELVGDLNEALGSFRIEIRKLTQGAKDSLIDSAKKARAAVEASKTDQEKKKQSAQAVARATMEDAQAPTPAEATPDEEAEARRNWGEVSAGWYEVWQWVKELRVEAIEGSTGRAKGHLRDLDLRSPVEVIVKLYDYGWFADDASDLAIEMAEIYLQNRPRQVVNKKTVKRFRKLFDSWTNMD